MRAGPDPCRVYARRGGRVKTPHSRVLTPLPSGDRLSFPLSASAGKQILRACGAGPTPRPPLPHVGRGDYGVLFCPPPPPCGEGGRGGGPQGEGVKRGRATRGGRGGGTRGSRI